MRGSNRKADYEWRATVRQTSTSSYSRATRVARKRPLTLGRLMAYLFR